MVTSPLISCLCVTHNSIKQLQRAINCFEAQSYNNKELIIIYERDDVEIKNYLKSINKEDIFSHEIPSNPKRSLGALRNISIEKSNGDFFCQWDDDDWYSSNRLESQFNVILQNCKTASMLLYWLMYDANSKQAYLSPFRLWEGSILCKKSVITNEIKYADMEKGEDTILLRKLITNNYIFPVINPSLYIYVYHGKNTWDYNHFNIFFHRGLKLSDYCSELVKDILDERYSVIEATKLLNDATFLDEIVFRYNMEDRYSLQLV